MSLRAILPTHREAAIEKLAASATMSHTVPAIRLRRGSILDRADMAANRSFMDEASQRLRPRNVVKQSRD
jgi:hypothetical protein